MRKYPIILYYGSCGTYLIIIGILFCFLITLLAMHGSDEVYYHVYLHVYRELNWRDDLHIIMVRLYYNYGCLSWYACLHRQQVEESGRDDEGVVLYLLVHRHTLEREHGQWVPINQLFMWSRTFCSEMLNFNYTRGFMRLVSESSAHSHFVQIFSMLVSDITAKKN